MKGKEIALLIRNSDLHRKLKILAIQKNKTMIELLEIIIAEYLKKQGE